MTLAIEKESPPLRCDEAGTIRVGGSRITLDVLLGFYKQGWPPEVIAKNYPALSLADVYGTITYYLRHRDEVDEYLDRRQQEADAMRREIESQPGYQEWRQQLAARLDARAKEEGLRK